MTRKEIKNCFNKIYSVGYCDLQFLLQYHNRVGYNSGVYGWNYDIFALDNGNIAICTGYRGMIGETISYEITKKYNEKARLIVSNWDINFDEKKKKIDKLIKKFIDEIQK